MVVTINPDGDYVIKLSKTEQTFLSEISTVSVRPPEKVLGSLLFGALVVESLELDGLPDHEPYDPSKRD